MTRVVCSRLAVVLFLLVIPRLADSHAFGARYDLPLPLGLVLMAAGMAVAVSFLGALVFLRRSAGRTIGFDIAIPAALADATGSLLGGLGLVALVTVLATATFGPPEPTRNLATVMVWILWWVGFLLVSALVVDLWPAIDPFRRIHLLVSYMTRQDSERALAKLPSMAGWLAPAGMLAMGWIELVSGWSESPRALAVLVCFYAVLAACLGVAYGTQWFRLADPLSRIFELISRVAPIAVMSHRRLRLRPFGEGLIDAGPAKPGEVALVACLIATVLFDGISETPAWASLLEFVSESRTLRPVLLSSRDHGVDLLKAIKTLGLVSTVVGFLGLYWLLSFAMRVCSGTLVSTKTVATALASSLLPIAVAYHLSHYLSYLLLGGQLAAPAASDPFGLGWDLLGTEGHPIDIGVIGTKQIWWIAVVALVLGHSLSVFVAHRRALVLFGSATPAARSQMPMLFAMVGLTMLSLWILAQPIIA